MRILLLLLICHGVEWREVAGARVFRISYESGGPLVKANVFVIDSLGDTVYTSTTDSTGTFYFTPKGVGPWKIKVLDPYGHGAIIEVRKKEEGAIQTAKRSSLDRILMGLLLIWGTTGTVFYFLARRKYAHT
jgi:hypothetical protein